MALLDTLSKRGIKGEPTAGIMSTRRLAESYLRDERYPDDDERVDGLIFHESLKCSVPGFITGLGGLSTNPIAIPTDIVGTWTIQARMAAAIAMIYHNDLDREADWTTIFACMLGERALKAFKDSAIDIARGLSVREISRMPGKSLAGINQKIGARLVSEIGEKGITRIGKLTPFIGEPISASIIVKVSASGNLAKSTTRSTSVVPTCTSEAPGQRRRGTHPPTTKI